MPSKKSKHRPLKWVSKENLVLLTHILLLLVLVALFRAGHHIFFLLFPLTVKWLREIIPLWSVMISALIGFSCVTFLIHKNDLFAKDYIIGLTGIVLSINVLSIGYQRYPSVFIFTLFAVIFINWFVMKMRLRMKKRRTGS